MKLFWFQYRYSHACRTWVLGHPRCEYALATFFLQSSEDFPYNHIEDDNSFVAVINNFSFSDRLAELSDMLFQPFELNTENYYSPLFDIDPDINFDDKIDLHNNSNCNYYIGNEFSMILKNRHNICPTENRLSLCHMNIRSLQANLHSFEKYLKNIDIKFSRVGITETWLQDHNCDLYNLNGYEFIGDVYFSFMWLLKLTMSNWNLGMDT